MSHIDSFRHELVGYLGYLPVYHPLEDINGDFVCSPKTLLLGGGSGEHPALVVENPTSTVAHFLNEVIKHHDELQHWEQIVTPYLEWDMGKILTFYEWSIQDYSNFSEMSQSKSLHNPSDGTDIEMWLVLGLGEFLFFSMPELAKELIGKLDEPYRYFFHMNYNNILIVPPNMPVYANGGNKFFNGAGKHNH